MFQFNPTDRSTAKQLADMVVGRNVLHLCREQHEEE
jgi:hypothetical protein